MFREIFDSHDLNRIRDRIYSSSESDFEKALASNDSRFTPDGIIPFFSPAADKHLEELAHRSSGITRARFGNTIQLYSPLYISNECNSSCIYCGFNARNRIKRVTLTPEEVTMEADALYGMGFRHILLLTGESRRAVPVTSMAEMIRRIHGKFSSISVEVYPMETQEYMELIRAGADGLTIYQETYDREAYAIVHPRGEKSDFYWRLDAPDRGGAAGFRRIGIGSLLGLSDWRIEGFCTALHAMYLSKKFWKSQVLISFPRLRCAPGDFKQPFNVTERDLAHLICVMRILLNNAGLVLSTREPAVLRDNLFPIGITTMSAGSKTSPGGYSLDNDAGGQFEIEDVRSPYVISEMLKQKGYDPVWKDWDRNFQA